MSCNFGVLGALSPDNFSRCYWELLKFEVIKLIVWAACPLCHKISSIFYKCNDISHSGVSTSPLSLASTDSSDDDTFKFEINIYLKNTDRQSITGIKLDNEN